MTINPKAYFTYHQNNILSSMSEEELNAFFPDQEIRQQVDKQIKAHKTALEKMNKPNDSKTD